MTLGLNSCLFLSSALAGKFFTTSTTKKAPGQMLTTIKGEINSNTTIVGGFNLPFTLVDRSSRLKINKGKEALNDALY